MVDHSAMEMVPLKSGVDEKFRSNGNRVNDMNLLHGSRKQTSPLPEVPIPPKALKHSRGVSHASCADIFEISRLSPEQQVHVSNEGIRRSTSLDFLRSDFNPPAKPPLRKEFKTNHLTPTSLQNATLRSHDKYTPIHAYEELQEFRDPLLINHQSEGVRNSFMANRSTARYDQSKPYPTEQLIPAYKEVGPRVSSNKKQAPPLPPPPTKNRPVMSNKCACVLISLLVICIISSVVTIAVVIIQPQKDANELTSQFEAWKSLKQSKLEKTKLKLNSTLTDYSNKIQELNESLAVVKNRSKLSQDELVRLLESAVSSLTPDQIAEIFGDVSNTAMARCTHEFYDIGISTSLAVTYTGEYYADKNFIITGVTCSISSDGYLASLQSRLVTGNDGITRTHYQCRCSKISGAVETPDERAECGIHYWQCPTTIA